MTGNAAQGWTKKNTVLAVPDDANDWTPFLRQDSKVLTMGSRHFRTMAVPKLWNTSRDVSHTLRSFFELQDLCEHSDEVWNWQDLTEILGISTEVYDMWATWRTYLAEHAGHLVTFTRGDKKKQSATQRQCPRIPYVETENSATFKGCPLTFLRVFVISLQQLTVSKYSSRHW